MSDSSDRWNELPRLEGGLEGQVDAVLIERRQRATALDQLRALARWVEEKEADFRTRFPELALDLPEVEASPAFDDLDALAPLAPSSLEDERQVFRSRRERLERDFQGLVAKREQLLNEEQVWLAQLQGAADSVPEGLEALRLALLERERQIANAIAAVFSAGDTPVRGVAVGKQIQSAPKDVAPKSAAPAAPAAPATPAAPAAPAASALAEVEEIEAEQPEAEESIDDGEPVAEEPAAEIPAAEELAVPDMDMDELDETPATDDMESSQAAPGDSEAPTAPEGRQNLRIAIEAPINLRVEHRLLQGSTENLSVAGVFIRTDALLPAGREVELTFHLPEKPNLRALGKVAWSRSKGPRGVAGLGIRFTRIDEEIRHALDGFVKTTGQVARLER